MFVQRQKLNERFRLKKKKKKNDGVVCFQGGFMPTPSFFPTFLCGTVNVGPFCNFICVLLWFLLGTTMAGGTMLVNGNGKTYE